ncbi:MAG TPA: dTDP-4-dehydrorhamnose reductase [Balneolaceae bacterium]|nr:dTDP-4-dehydrorhamnose reductase [Balneolaceae bacterium]
MHKILLSGASGQLGRQWQQFFKGKKEYEWDIIPYTSSQLDITRFEEVRRTISEHQPDLIINAAAYTKVDQAEVEREKARRVNAAAVKNLAELCSKFAIRLIHFSTDYVFAGTKQDRERFPEGYPEDHRADPVNWYGQTKWEGEQAIRRSGCPHLIIRASWLCGAYGDNFVRTMLQLAESHDELDVVDDQVGSPTFTEALVQHTYKLIEQSREGTYHQTSRGKISWADFAEGIFNMAGRRVRVNRIPSADFPTKAKRPFYSKLSTKKIEKVEGIQLEDWKAGLRRLLKQIA